MVKSMKRTLDSSLTSNTKKETRKEERKEAKKLLEDTKIHNNKVNQIRNRIEDILEQRDFNRKWDL
ncbi:hypothetical protein AB4346_08645 [Vibrio breoganii]